MEFGHPQNIWNLSVISRAEILAGLQPSQVPAVKEWLDRYPTFAIDRQFATRNMRDFPPHRYSFVVVPYTVK
jgi:hypothetical protein